MQTGSTVFCVKVDFNNVGAKRTVMQRWLKDICFNEPWEKRGACPLKSFQGAEK